MRAVERPEDGLPPYDENAERTTLADLLLGGADHYGRVRDFLRPEHFFLEKHRQIYVAVQEISLAGSPIDIATVASFLKAQGRLAQLDPQNGLAYLTELLNATPATTNIVAHARVIHDRWRERETIAAAQRIARRGYLGVENTQEYLDGAVRTLSEIARASVTARRESNVDAIRRIVAELAERSEAKTKVPIGIPTGLSEFDEEWGGLHGTDLTAFVARPGAGKTSLALQLLATVSASRLGVLLFSSDSNYKRLSTELISHVAKVDSKRMRLAPEKLTVEDWSRITSAASSLGARKYWIDDTRGITVSQVRARTLATADEAMRGDRVPLGLVIIDYYQQLANHTGNARAKKHEWLAEAANQLKTLAETAKIPVVVMAQQKPEDQHGKPVWDVADCSKLEHEADNVYFIEKTGKTTRRLRGRKVRAGEIKSIALSFEPPSRTFGDPKLEADSRRYAKEPPPGFYDDNE